MKSNSRNRARFQYDSTSRHCPVSLDQEVFEEERHTIQILTVYNGLKFNVDKTMHKMTLHSLQSQLSNSSPRGDNATSVYRSWGNLHLD